MTLILKSDNPLLRPSSLAAVLDPEEIFTNYEAAVVADGGTIHDDAATLAFISDLVEAGVYNAVAIAVTAEGGTKALGAADSKHYSVGPGFVANDYNNNLEWVYADDASFAYRTWRFATANSVIGWSGIEPEKANALSVLIQNPLPDPLLSARGTGVTFVDGVKLLEFIPGQNYFATSGLAFNFPYEGTGGRTGPEVDPALPFVATWRWDWDKKEIWIGPDGVDTLGAKVYNGAPADLPAAMQVRLLPQNVNNTRLAEAIVLNGYHTLEQTKALAALRAARY